MSPRTMYDPVPVITDINDLYPKDAVSSQEQRFERLKERFLDLYKKKPNFIARSPGRVNLIGEHIDYSLYEVLPMAIAADVLIAVSAIPQSAENRDDVKVHVANLNFQRFKQELHAEALPFPKMDPPITFMIAQSFVAADKHVAAPENYNLRVVECTLAAELLAVKMGVKIKGDSGPLGTSLRGCQNACFENLSETPFPGPEQQVERMLTFAEKLLDKSEGYSREEISSSLSLSVPALEEKFMTKFPVRAERFYLRQRAQHVFTEALRVQVFKRLLRSPPSDANTSLLPKLGAILNESHASSRDIYVHSCPEIDQMCEIALEAGSYGGRVTGAGWGGCSVHLVPKDKVDVVRAAWEEKYYRKREPGISKEKLAEAVVVSEPGHGAMV
ncbi:hypothetical protein P7C71_g1645, partial [Lecanoromycetidae sp. Uapishka_2]